MKKSLFIFASIFISLLVKSQNTSTIYDPDTVKSKMKIYSAMIKIADGYQIKAGDVLKNVKFYKTQARTYLDSSYILAKKAEIDKSRAELYMLQFDFVYDLANQCFLKSDSLLKVANAYQDTAVIKNKEAETYYLQLLVQAESLMKNDSLNPTIYTIQLGAGEMDIDYFSKATEFTTITPSDGVKRFITGKYTSLDEALEQRQKLIDMGYYDAFIRSMESLNY